VKNSIPFGEPRGAPELSGRGNILSCPNYLLCLLALFVFSHGKEKAPHKVTAGVLIPDGAYTLMIPIVGAYSSTYTATVTVPLPVS
jgi:hypothetical protein